MISKMTEEQVIAGVEAGQASGGKLVQTGAWFWLEFDSKPSNEVRSSLKAAGWKWSKNKAKWYLATTHSFHSKGFEADWYYITNKYGERILSDDRQMAAA